MKGLQLILAGTILAFTFTTQAQVLNGSISASVFPGDSGKITSSSLTLFQTNIVAVGATGDFASTVPAGSLLYAYTGTINGLSSTPLDVSIDNYFVFSGQYPGGVSGTTPPDRFEFDLATIAENPGTAVGETIFSGTGTLVDTAPGGFSSSPADFTVDFFSNDYTISLETVPEPATLSLAAAGLLGALVLRRRKA